MSAHNDLLLHQATCCCNCLSGESCSSAPCLSSARGAVTRPLVLSGFPGSSCCCSASLPVVRWLKMVSLLLSDVQVLAASEGDALKGGAALRSASCQTTGTRTAGALDLLPGLSLRLTVQNDPWSSSPNRSAQGTSPRPAPRPHKATTLTSSSWCPDPTPTRPELLQAPCSTEAMLGVPRGRCLLVSLRRPSLVLVPAGPRSWVWFQVFMAPRPVPGPPSSDPRLPQAFLGLDRRLAVMGFLDWSSRTNGCRQVTLGRLSRRRSHRARARRSLCRLRPTSSSPGAAT